MDAGQQFNLTATVTNDSQGKGVTWSVTGSSCSGSACGSLANVTTTSATYQAPATLSAKLSVTVTATSVADTTKSASVSVTDTPPPSITTTSVPAATVGTAYSTTLAASGGAGTLTWKISAGALPAGLSLDAATGAITGTPTAAGTSAFTAQVTDSASPAMSATQNLSLKVNPAPLAITTSSLPSGTVSSNYSATLQASGGTTPYSWSVTTGALPAGLALGAATGAITGVPTASGSSTFKVTVTDTTTPTAMTAVQQFTIQVNATLTLTTTSLPNGTVGTAYNQTLQSSGGTAPVSWSVTVGTLPAGLKLDSATGVISGTPTAAGTSNFTVQAADSSSPQQTATKALSITIAAAPLSITTTSLPSGTVGISYSTTLQSSGGTPPITWSLTGLLPAGLSLNTSTGAITGTPTASGTSNFSVTATDSATPTAQTATQSLSITVNSSGVNNGELNGQYAFLMSGYDGSGPVEIAGSFTADGAGNLSSGLEDVNNNAGVSTSQSFTGTYAIGADNLGTLTMGSSTFQFSIGSISSGVGAKGHIVEFDATGTNVAGVLEKQDPTAFSLSAAAGDYAFGFAGISSSVSGARLTLAGRFTVSSTGAVSNGEIDADDAGLPNHVTSVTGTVTLAASGRGTTTLSVGGGSIHTAFYVVSANESLYIGIDPLSGGNGVFSGSALKQSGGPFSNSSLNGVSVISTQAETITSGTSDVQVGLITTDGAGSFTFSTDENNAGVITQNSLTGTYSVASNGRVTATGGKHPPVFYLVSANQGFLVGTDPSATGGSFERQAAGPFSNSSLSGNLISGDMAPVNSASSLTVGVASSDGAGNLTGTNDQNQSGTLTAGQTFTATYSVASSGRGTVTSGADTDVIYLISGSKAVLMSTKTTNTDAGITVVEK